MAKTVEIEKIYPLSPMQEGMLFHTILDKKSTAYIGLTVFLINGPMDPSLMEKSINHLVKRYDNLRTVFVYDKINKPRQVVLKNVSAKIHYQEITHLEKEKQELFLGKYTQTDREKGFELTKDILMRVSIFKLAEESYRLLWCFHNILMDGWCLGIIFRDFIHIYNSLKEGKPFNLKPVIPYKNYIDWLQKQDQDEGLEYWRRYLEGFEQQTGLPGYTHPVKNEKYLVKEERVIIDELVAKALQNIARKNQVTINVLFQTIWGILLQRYNNTNDVVFGAVVSGRSSEIAGIENIVGLFINTIPVRIKIYGSENFSQLLQQVHQDAVLSKPYEYLPLAAIQGNSSLKRDLINHIMICENYPIGEEVKDVGYGIAAVEDYQQSNYDFNIYVIPVKRFVMRFNFNASRYEPPYIKRVTRHFNRVIEQVAAAPDITITSIDLLTGEEKKQLLYDFNNTGAEYPQNKTIAELFEQQVEKTPDNIALSGPGLTSAQPSLAPDDSKERKHLTYRELNHRANQLAKTLKGNGVKPNHIAAIMMDHIIEMIIGMLGILKPGGVYFPINPEYPRERIKYMLRDSLTTILLTQSNLVNPGESLGFTGHIIEICDDTCDRDDREEPGETIKPNDLAYVIYTSGSTGKPKGVLVEHQNVVRLVKNANYIDFQPAQRLLMTGSIIFDVTTFEIWGVLVNGLSLHLIHPNDILAPGQLEETVITNKISILHLIPQLFNQVLVQSPGIFAGLQYFLIGGDLVRPTYINQLRSKFQQIKIVHLYGPTENTTFSTFFPIEKDYEERIPIGTPISNSTVYILNKNEQLQPIAAAGELYTGGDGVSRGYLNRPELTQEKYVPHPFIPGQRLYKTGDLARWLPDGNIEFMGRLDHQVKIRGFRIELGEIENILLTHPEIEECVVLAGKINRENQLIAYYKKKNTIQLWPSLAEHFVYDDLIYHSMVNDEARNEKYRNAIKKVVKNKTILEIGPGSEVILARMCIEAGAKKVYAVEILAEAYQKAREKIKTLGMEDKIILIHGDITNVILPEKVDYCVSEIVGSIGGSEGAAKLINSARHLLKNPNCMIPARSMTKIAAITLPENQFQYSFEEIGAYYVEKVFEQKGHQFDLRLCLYSFTVDNIISNPDIFEELNFTQKNPLEHEHDIHLQINKNAVLNGFIVWLNLYCDEEEIVDTLEKKYIWLPVYFPVFPGGESVQPGDHIKAKITRKLSGNQLNPDYTLKGVLYKKQKNQSTEFTYHSPHLTTGFKGNDFYKKIFSKPQLKITKNITSRDLREFLAARVPGHMIPSYFMQIQQVPLTPNGKLDRKALPQPEVTSVEKYAAPRNDIEKKLVRLWAEVLEIDKEMIGINDNFFELGGHSLRATTLVSRIHKELDLDIPLSEIFNSPTIRGLEKSLGKMNEKKYHPIKIVEKKEFYTLSSVQKRLYAIQQRDPDNTNYNLSAILILEGEVDRHRLKESFEQLIKRHESFRTAFEVLEYEPVQKIDENVEFEIEYHSPERKTQSTKRQQEHQATEAQHRANAIENFIRPFDLSQPPLLRVGLIEEKQNQYLLMIEMHHIIADGSSVSLFIGEMIRLYQGRDLHALRIQYKDYSAWQMSKEQQAVLRKQEQFWSSQLTGDLPVLNLPLDYERPAIQSFEGNTKSFLVGIEETQKLKMLLSQVDATLFMGLLAIFNLFISKLSGQEDIIVGTAIAGRKHPDLQNIMGMLVNTLVLRNHVEGEKSFKIFLQEVRDNLLRVYDNQDYLFEDLVETIPVKRDMSRNPLFDVGIGLQNMDMPKLEIPGLKAATYRDTRKESKIDLSLGVVPTGDKIVCTFEYCTKLFKEETIDRFIDYFKEILAAVPGNMDIKLKDINISHNLYMEKLKIPQEDQADFAF